MTHTARNWEPGAIYHIDVCSHDGEPILAMDEDRAFFVARAARIFAEEGVVCFAWAVLVNHFHLLARFDGPPGHAMQRLKTAIAKRVRRLRGGKGAVFQNPYWSAVCTDEAAVLTRLAYVTANPIHHRVVASVEMLAAHAWSSLGEVTGRREAKLAQPAATLALLHPQPELAFEGLIELLEIRVRIWDARDAANGGARTPDVDDPPEAEIPLPRRLGGAIGAPQSLGAISGGPLPAVFGWESAAARRAILRAARWTPGDLVPAACDLTGADEAVLRAGRKRRAESRARAIVAHVAIDYLAWPTNEVAAAVGVSSSAVVQARGRGAVFLRETGVSAEELARTSREGSRNCGS